MDRPWSTPSSALCIAALASIMLDCCCFMSSSSRSWEKSARRQNSKRNKKKAHHTNLPPSFGLQAFHARKLPLRCSMSVRRDPIPSTVLSSTVVPVRVVALAIPLRAFSDFSKSRMTPACCAKISCMICSSSMTCCASTKIDHSKPMLSDLRINFSTASRVLMLILLTAPPNSSYAIVFCSAYTTSAGDTTVTQGRKELTIDEIAELKISITSGC